MMLTRVIILLEKTKKFKHEARKLFTIKHAETMSFVYIHCYIQDYIVVHVILIYFLYIV